MRSPPDAARQDPTARIAQQRLRQSGPTEGSVALSPLVGLVREDLLGAATILLREAASRPKRTLQLWRDLAGDALAIAKGASGYEPDAKDKRFQDAAWSTNPFLKTGLRSYLALDRRARNWVEELEIDREDRVRAMFMTRLVLDALAPSNFLVSNPSALKKAFDTGGASLLKGLRHVYDDFVKNDMLVSQVDRRPFKVGENLAVQPGAVVYRTEMMELLQYSPQTPQVYDRPLLIIPPQINKAYINDLAPTKSMVRFLVEQGIPVFLVSWRNPTREHRDWGLPAYVDALIATIAVVREITGSEKVNVSGACSGGITTATMLSKLKAQQSDVIGCATLQVCVLDPQPADGELGALISERGLQLARQRSAKKGVLEGKSLNRMFAWLRPNDLVWNYVVSNYLHGDDPPAFDVLFWNNDSTNLPAALHSDYLSLYEERPFAEPGRHELAGHVADLKAVDVDVFILAGIADHITPWRACYRAIGMFGSNNVEFVLSQGGHIQALLNPPSNPKARYFRARGALPENADKWIEQADEATGSWWVPWAEWLKDRSGGLRPAPAALGSDEHPILDPAPGRYVHG